MSSQDLQVLDTLGTSDWISGELSDDGPYSIQTYDPHKIPMIYSIGGTQNWIYHHI